MRRVLLSLVALLCLVTEPAVAAKWTVDHAKSRLGFTVAWSGQPFVATFAAWNAEIDFDPADLAHAKAVVEIKLASEISGVPDNDDGLKGTEGFAVGQFPVARFETTEFRSVGNGRYVATGRLDLHGVSRTVTLPFTLTFAGNAVHMTGKTVLSRIDFGLGHGEWASADTIAHAVTVTIDLTATKAR
ncbi:MAG TPA: YceI family protein [Rhizomicrobium sp.]|nr:YceI family protein [Rhizomicrobium sp.]